MHYCFVGAMSEPLTSKRYDAFCLSSPPASLELAIAGRWKGKNIIS